MNRTSKPFFSSERRILADARVIPGIDFAWLRRPHLHERRFESQPAYSNISLSAELRHKSAAGREASHTLWIDTYRLMNPVQRGIRKYRIEFVAIR